MDWYTCFFLSRISKLIARFQLFVKKHLMQILDNLTPLDIGSCLSYFLTKCNFFLNFRVVSFQRLKFLVPFFEERDGIYMLRVFFETIWDRRLKTSFVIYIAGFFSLWNEIKKKLSSILRGSRRSFKVFPWYTRSLVHALYQILNCSYQVPKQMRNP